MKFTITAMSLGEILQRGVMLFFRRLPVLLGIEFIVLSPILIAHLTMPDFAVNPISNLVFLIPSLVLAPIGSAAILRVITQEYLEQPTGLVDAFQFALGRFLPLLGTLLLAGFGIALGYMACLIPGIYLAVIWAFASQIVVMEDLAGSSALTRSKELIEGYFWRVLGIVFVIGFGVALASAAINVPLTFALPFQELAPGQNPFFPLRVGNYLNYFIIEVVTTLVNIVGQTFVAICTTLLYFDLRNRKEAFDVSHIVTWMDQYRDWRDEPDAALPPVVGAPPSETGIKEPGTALPPADTNISQPDTAITSSEAGIQESKPAQPETGAEPPREGQP